MMLDSRADRRIAAVSLTGMFLIEALSTAQAAQDVPAIQAGLVGFAFACSFASAIGWARQIIRRREARRVAIVQEVMSL